MLSRVAETFYWIGRYHERAENIARLLKVNTNLALDLPKGIMPLWEPMISIMGCEQAYANRHDELTERRIINFLISDDSNPSSILSSLEHARESARTVREILPREGWESINLGYQQAIEHKNESYSRSARQAYLDKIMRDLQHITGVLAGTMNHNTAYDFLNIGRKIERADMTTRIVDVKSDVVIPENVTQLRPFEDLVWLSILKSLSGYQMYRQSMQVRLRRDDILNFLFYHKEFPRSVGYCMRNLSQDLKDLPNNSKPLKHVKKIKNELKRTSKERFNNEELHLYIDKIQLQLSKMHHNLQDVYFS